MVLTDTGLGKELSFKTLFLWNVWEFIDGKRRGKKKNEMKFKETCCDWSDSDREKYALTGDDRY